MIIDSLGRVSDAQSLTASALCTDKIDLGAPTVARQIGTGTPLGFLISVDVAADHTTGNETYEIDIVSDADSALGSPTTHAQYVISYAKLTAGALIFLPLPQGNADYERYLGLSYVLGGTTPTVTLTADLDDHDMASVKQVYYAKGYSV